MNAQLTTWVPGADGSQFGIQNLPYGVFATTNEPRVGVAIGDYVVDLAALSDADPAAPAAATAFAAPTLNRFLRLGPAAWRQVRDWITDRLSTERHRRLVEPTLLPRDQVQLRLPVEVGDFVDFYASEHHATNLGHILRPNETPLPPNWKHLPIGYHGRAGTVIVSGSDITRPRGQRKPADSDHPDYGPSTRLDVEVEVGFIVGAGSPRGSTVSVNELREHVFGVVLANDWSARDIQAWEYRPLGPFLGKSFATSISPWVVPLAALDAAVVPTPPQVPEPLPYLRPEQPGGLDLTLELFLNGQLLSRPRYAEMYWTPAQMLAHLTCNGANVRTGDLYASGTVSGPHRDEWGSLIELTWNGRDPIRLLDGSTRAFLDDGDEVRITGTAPGPDGTRIGFGDVVGRIRPALSTP